MGDASRSQCRRSVLFIADLGDHSDASIILSDNLLCVRRQYYQRNESTGKIRTTYLAVGASSDITSGLGYCTL